MGSELKLFCRILIVLCVIFSEYDAENYQNSVALYSEPINSTPTPFIPPTPFILNSTPTPFIRLSLAEYNKRWIILMKLGEPMKMSISPLILDAT